MDVKAGEAVEIWVFKELLSAKTNILVEHLAERKGEGAMRMGVRIEIDDVL